MSQRPEHFTDALQEWVLVTEDPVADYHPTFTGNGYLAARVPAAGNGFAEAPIRTQFHVAGLYAQKPGEWSRKAGLPAWTTLDVGDDSGTFNEAFASERRGEYLVGGDWSAVAEPQRSAARGVGGYRQALDLRNGVITTSARWTSPAGRVTDVRYQVLTDRSRRHVAAVTVQVTPWWDGRLDVSDALDDRAAGHLRQSESGGDGHSLWRTMTAVGSGTTVAVATVLDRPEPASHQVLPGMGQYLSVDVRAGHTYTFTKYVGIATGHDSAAPLSLATAVVEEAAAAGFRQLVSDNRRAWRREWEGDIVVRGDRRLQRQVRASKYYLLTSVRDDCAWSPSPAGLSSDGYNGHVFWDTETWIWPSLLAQHPAIAEKLLDYRVNRLADARAYARGNGQRGVRFPWESGLTGEEDTPTWADFGRYEHHVTADVALAFWQYWLATGDTEWLRDKGWPVLRGVADFWVSRATTDADGRYHIEGVIPPDEYAPPGDDSVYTNVAARTVLGFAVEAARLLGRRADPAWRRVADALVVPFDEELGVHPEYRGYQGQRIKQADVVMLAYPWEHPQPDRVTRSDLDYYVPRTDEDGPSMTDSVHSIVRAALGDAEQAFAHTRRSVEPFLRGPFDQFAEDRKGGAFTFLTGHGGFLQEFLYGYSGLRWRDDRMVLAPVLPAELEGLALHAVRWRGRTVDIDISPDVTRVALRSGAPLTVECRGGWACVEAGHEIAVPTLTSEERRQPA
ncbi:glycosyl hydrolase family 65 protein [Streptomyces sp. NPDC007325]|uniref:glycosyl hydrolase family 65 protein n=1 Tax=Streptomyces sp. NPDC007325 TaxID=3154588 RepID=UPI0033F041D7